MKNLIAFVFAFIWLIPTQAAGDEKKPVTIAIIQEWTQFNPVNVSVASTQVLLNFVVRGMVERDASGALIADLAEQVPSLKNKKVTFKMDKKVRKIVAEWTIKANAKWGDGTDINCADWWLGWQVGLNPNVSTSERQIYSKIEKIEWTESLKNTCKVTYANDDWTYDRDLPPVLPTHLEAAVFEKWKNKSEAYDQNSTYAKSPTQPGLYNGPYLVSDFQIGSHIVLKANPYFYGEKPSIKNFIIKNISDTSSLRAQLKSGDVDIISANGFPADIAILLDQETKTENTKFVVKFQSSPIFQGLFLNLENEFLRDLEVRKALSLAINKKELSQAFFQGKLAPAERIFPESSPGHQKEVAIYNSNLAKKTLENAGWKLNANKIFEKNGKELALEFTTSSGIKILETIQGFICNNFIKVGIKCLIKNQPPRVFLGQSVPHGEFTLGMFGQDLRPDTSMTGMFSSKEIPDNKNGWAGANLSRWKSEKVDLLLKQFDKEWDSKKRISLMRAIEKEVLKDIPLIPLYHRKEAFILPKNLKGFFDDISGLYFVFPEKWKM